MENMDSTDLGYTNMEQLQGFSSEADCHRHTPNNHSAPMFTGFIGGHSLLGHSVINTNYSSGGGLDMQDFSMSSAGGGGLGGQLGLGAFPGDLSMFTLNPSSTSTHPHLALAAPHLMSSAARSAGIYPYLQRASLHGLMPSEPVGMSMSLGTTQFSFQNLQAAGNFANRPPLTLHGLPNIDTMVMGDGGTGVRSHHHSTVVPVAEISHLHATSIMQQHQLQQHHHQQPTCRSQNNYISAYHTTVGRTMDGCHTTALESSTKRMELMSPSTSAPTINVSEFLNISSNPDVSSGMSIINTIADGKRWNESGYGRSGTRMEMNSDRLSKKEKCSAELLSLCGEAHTDSRRGVKGSLSNTGNFSSPALSLHQYEVVNGVGTDGDIKPSLVDCGTLKLDSNKSDLHHGGTVDYDHQTLSFPCDEPGFPFLDNPMDQSGNTTTDINFRLEATGDKKQIMSDGGADDRKVVSSSSSGHDGLSANGSCVSMAENGSVPPDLSSASLTEEERSMATQSRQEFTTFDPDAEAANEGDRTCNGLPPGYGEKLKLDVTVHVDDSQCIVVDGMKRWTCQMCPKMYSTKHNLITHILGHSGIKPHCCIVCGKFFKQV